MADKGDEQRKLAARQRYLLAASVTQRMAGEVEGVAIEAQGLRQPLCLGRRLEEGSYAIQHGMLVQGDGQTSIYRGRRRTQRRCVVRLFGHDDVFAAAPVEIEGGRAGSAACDNGEGDVMLGEHLTCPPVVLRQLDAVTGRHQPSRQGRTNHHILGHHQDQVPHGFPLVRLMFGKVLAQSVSGAPPRR